MHRSPLTRPLTVLAFALAAGAGAAWAGKAHQHGVLTLAVALEGPRVLIEMEVPLDNLLGFERAPRTDAERQAAADVLTRLRAPDRAPPLLALDAAAQCRLTRAEVQAPVLEPGASAAAGDGHADLEARYEFSCVKPGELRALDVGLFEAYRRTRRIDVQVAGPNGQARATLQRPARKVPLVR